ncbi:MAG TPA: hypothetical protein VGK31_05005 [Thermoanaerobaculia bacterium]
MSKPPAWHFREMDPGEVHVDPVHDEFFKMQDLADALVRESIQNSLDARRGRGAVRVRFAFGVGTDALPAEGAEHYFTGLREHLEAVSSSIHSVIPKEDESVPYLLIEDFGTRGLTGDPHIDPELAGDEETKNDFFYFWRNVGRSNKSDIDRGRWGLGKAVFAVASRIRTIFGLTVRADDRRGLLLGQSVLKTHILEGTRVYPYGFFARFERKNGLPLPIEEAMLLERFADDFRLHRAEPGLSIVVPYFRAEDLSFERIVESAVRQYFYPILRGELVVDVDDGVRKESISARTIDRWASGRPEIALARWSLLEAPATTFSPRSGEKALEPGLRERFERGERIAVRVPLLVKRKKAKAAASHLDIFLEKDETLRRGEYHFIRRGITIPDVKSTAAADKPVRALVVVDHDALSTFLGDAENPAHSDWSERADKLRMHYDHHAATLRIVKNSAALLAALLARPPEGRSRDFLEDIFSIEMPEEGKEKLPGTPRPSITGDHTERPVSISRIAGGFTIRGAGDGQPLIAELAYRVRIGNPFRKHSPFDFDLTRGDVDIDADGAIVHRTAANAIRFTPTKPRFQITMKGFDARRDLVVRVSEDAAEAQLH